MKTPEVKIKIARDFIACHKTSKPSAWGESDGYDEDEILIRVYYQLVNGAFNTVMHNNRVFSVEIRGRDTPSGNPVLFEWS